MKKKMKITTEDYIRMNRKICIDIFFRGDQIVNDPGNGIIAFPVAGKPCNQMNGHQNTSFLLSDRYAADLLEKKNCYQFVFSLNIRFGNRKASPHVARSL